MNLKNKNIYIPGFVPGETADEVFDNVVNVMEEISTPRERHIVKYAKRARIRKKYIDRLVKRAVAEILFRTVMQKIAEKFNKSKEGQCFSSDDGA